ncbi:MAG TPA: TetR/AcrR family transcriptional regulator [Chitinophagaceae bacterium]|nr:TetR/AcrR family transcriptional regulator [Chitinophagaceae bacterium]
MGKITALQNGSKKDVITKKASLLFLKKGFPSTSMRDIAGAIGVEASSLYNHIASKSEILEEICFRMAALFMNHLKQVENSRQGSLAKIEAIIRFHIYMMVHEFENIYIADHEWIHLPEPWLNDYKLQRRNYRSRVSAILKKGIDRKELRKLNTDIAVHTVLAAINGIEGWHRSGRKLEARELEENMVKFLIAGLKK